MHLFSSLPFLVACRYKPLQTFWILCNLILHLRKHQNHEKYLGWNGESNWRGSHISKWPFMTPWTASLTTSYRCRLHQHRCSPTSDWTYREFISGNGSTTIFIHQVKYNFWMSENKLFLCAILYQGFSDHLSDQSEVRLENPALSEIKIATTK